MTVFGIGIIFICVKEVQTFKLLRIRLRIAVNHFITNKDCRTIWARWSRTRC